LLKQKKPDTRRVQRLLHVLGLAGELLSRPLSVVSTGERQRLALVRALIDDPKVLLLDEPTAALDPQATALVEEVIKYQILSGHSVLLASHNRAQIERLSHARLLLPKRTDASASVEHPI
jgi:ABC-type multidrug transport system ATPase subunit